ncbi:Protein spinster 3 [Perkinsus olseni]|uniref:Protein spinster 3 n=1 Tax=Perkinsus olseni TaxID=32597 RepID=A0A7J6RG47_PEROL|nr:Protein spinster 3 [Perkinsus olseni]
MVGVTEQAKSEHHGSGDGQEEGMCTCARCIALALQHTNARVMMAQQNLEIALRAGPRQEGDDGAGHSRVAGEGPTELTDELELRRRELQLERAKELQQHIYAQMELFQFWVQQLYTAQRPAEDSKGEKGQAKSAPFMITPYTHQWLISGTHRAADQSSFGDDDSEEEDDEETSSLGKCEILYRVISWSRQIDVDLGVACMGLCIGPKTHLAFFTLCEILVYFDRGLIAGLNLYLKDSLNLTDFEVGLLGGMFILGYVVASPLFAILGQVSGVWTIRSICIGLIVWVIANVLTGVVPTSFGLIVACRTLTGVGEAAFCSLAPPIIDDSAPPGKGSTFLGIFFMALYVGQALGYVGSGFFSTWESGQYAFLGEALIMVIIVALAFIWQNRFKVPARIPAKYEGSLLKQFLVLASNPTYMTLIFGYSAFMFAVGGFAYWGPAVIQEIWKASQTVGSMGFGALTVICGILGTLLGGYVLDVMSRKLAGRKSRLHVSCILSFVLITASVPFVIPAAWSNSVYLFFALMFIVEFFLFSTTAPTNVAIMEAVPAHLRGQALAISIGVSHILGDFPSPILMGIWNDHIGYRWSLCICGTWLLLCVVLWLTSSLLSRKSDVDIDVESKASSSADVVEVP